jgi:hypothetical protein
MTANSVGKHVTHNMDIRLQIEERVRKPTPFREILRPISPPKKIVVFYIASKIRRSQVSSMSSSG